MTPVTVEQSPGFCFGQFAVLLNHCVEILYSSTRCLMEH